MTDDTDPVLAAVDTLRACGIRVEPEGEEGHSVIRHFGLIAEKRA